MQIQIRGKWSISREEGTTVTQSMIQWWYLSRRKFQTSDHSMTHLRTLNCSRKKKWQREKWICCTRAPFLSRLSVLCVESCPSQQGCGNKVSPRTRRPPVHWHRPVLVPVFTGFVSEMGVWCWASPALEAMRVSAGQPRWFAASSSATGEVLIFQNKGYQQS